ncbi:MAG: ATP-binding protein [Candidatus Saganbacteria bacterium]|nr:ATP-binding protein [Candidatus Saganbacteria bacterium]
MIIAVASGKGGTGKTLVATSLALSLGQNVQLLDCDVEEPNAAIFIKPKIEQSMTASVPVPTVDESKCDYCGKCAEVCEYHAIVVAKNKVLIFPELCHSCGACTLLCPRQAITERERVIGRIDIGHKEGLRFVQGCLNVGEAISPPLIRRVKELIDPGRTVIIDSPPGTSCPVIAAVKGCDFCLLVTEPTPFGLNDLVLAVETVRKLGIPFGVIINRADLGDNKTEEYCAAENIPVLLRIPFKKEIAEAYAKGTAAVEIMPECGPKFRGAFEAAGRIVERRGGKT